MVPETVAQNSKDRGVHKRRSQKSLEYDISQIGSRPIGKGVNFYSLEKEQQLGRELASELEAQVRLLDDPVVNEYVNRVGQNLVRHSDAQVPFTIRVINNDEINAMALPGGFFYVNSGLILDGRSGRAHEGNWRAACNWISPHTHRQGPDSRSRSPQHSRGNARLGGRIGCQLDRSSVFQ
jgi:hypothetical protein